MLNEQKRLKEIKGDKELSQNISQSTVEMLIMLLNLINF